jgi:hypothetical protein
VLFREESARLGENLELLLAKHTETVDVLLALQLRPHTTHDLDSSLEASRRF